MAVPSNNDVELTVCPECKDNPNLRATTTWCGWCLGRGVIEKGLIWILTPAKPPTGPAAKGGG